MARGGVSGLVAGTVFNTDERQELSLAGSIPVRLRHHARHHAQVHHHARPRTSAPADQTSVLHPE